MIRRASEKKKAFVQTTEAVTAVQPQWVLDAWAALTSHEQYAIKKMAWCFHYAKPAFPDQYLPQACADVIRHRGGKLPDSPDRYFDALTSQEKRIVEFSRWRSQTKRFVDWSDYGRHYQDILRRREQPSPE